MNLFGFVIADELRNHSKHRVTLSPIEQVRVPRKLVSETSHHLSLGCGRNVLERQLQQVRKGTHPLNSHIGLRTPDAVDRRRADRDAQAVSFEAGLPARPPEFIESLFHKGREIHTTHTPDRTERKP